MLTKTQIINVRKAHDELRLSSRSEVNENIYNTFTNGTDGYARYSIKGLNDGKDITVVHAFKDYTLKGLSGTVIYNNVNNASTHFEGELILQQNETVIILHD